jgi:hydroxymethylglutaryl-CoA lyase
MSDQKNDQKSDRISVLPGLSADVLATPADALIAPANVSATPDVVLCECFARDGLQHETLMLDVNAKRGLVEAFALAGFPRVEATSYSNPTVIAQFADASDLLKGLARLPGVYYKATCANTRAVERALIDADAGFGANEISLLVSASEAHSAKNLRRSREDQWANVRNMVALAGDRFRLIGTISVAFGCPFEGAVPAERVLGDVERMLDLGVTYVTLGDTSGMANPRSTRELFRTMLTRYPECTPIAHFHDSRGTGIVNYVGALEAGVRHFDCAFGGVGGHPSKVKYGGGFTGNVSTEDWVNLLASMGVDTGIDLTALMQLSAQCEEALGRELYSKVARTGLNPLIPGMERSA